MSESLSSRLELSHAGCMSHGCDHVFSGFYNSITMTPGFLLYPVFSVCDTALSMILSRSDIPPILMELTFVGIKLAGFARVVSFHRNLQGSDE